MEFLKIRKLPWNWAMGLGLSVKLIQKNLKQKDEFQREEAIKWNTTSVFFKAPLGDKQV